MRYVRAQDILPQDLLDQLQQYGADIVSRRRLEGIHITRLRIPEALVKGEKVVVENVLSGGSEC